MANYSKSCRDCGRSINLRQMPHGQWVAFEGDQVHKCKTPVRHKVVSPSKPSSEPPAETPSKPFTPNYPKVQEPSITPPNPLPSPPQRDPKPTIVIPVRPVISPSLPPPTYIDPAPTQPINKRANGYGAVRGIIATLLGSAFGLFFMAFSLLSLPLSVLAVMHFTGWSWFGALVSTLVFSCIPVIGQFGHLILAVLGAYYLWNANFDWQKAAYPTAQTFSIATLSADELGRFKNEVVRPSFERACKADALKISGFDGKLPERVGTRCECIAAEFSARLTRDDLVAYEKMGQYSVELQQRLKPELQRACTN